MRPAQEMATDAPLRRFSAEESCLTYKTLRTAGCGGGFLSGLGCGGGFTATLGLWRSRGRFANQFGRHDARYEQLGAMMSKSTAVRSWSEAVTIPRPYISCLMV